MITVTKNRTKPANALDASVTTFRSATGYYETVAETVSNEAVWQSLRLYKTREKSNDLCFSKFERQTLVIELSGTARHLSNFDGITSEGPTKNDDVCQIPAGVSGRFAWETIGDSQESLVLEFDSNLFVTYCPEFVSDTFLSGHLTPHDYEQKLELSYLVRLLARELDEHQKRGRLFADSIIRLLAIEIAHSAWTTKPLTMSAKGAVSKNIRITLDFIENHFMSEISLADLSKASGLSATQLTSGFRHYVGTTPYAYVLDQRIQRAVHLLNNTGMPIAEVALEAGFTDQQQMTHAFRRRVNRTPGSFRARTSTDTSQPD
jgi:AraC family transcriptional regulator